MSHSLARKTFAVGLAASTILMGLAPLAAHAAAHSAGTNVKSSDGTIWMVTTDAHRRAYTSAGAFLSYGFNSFAATVDANAEDLALPAGSFIAPQDGKIFCATETKASDVKGECSLVTGGNKAAFTSEAVFTGLGFSFSRAQYGDSSFLTKTSNVDNTSASHRPGVLVNNNGTVQLVGTSSLLGIPDLATFNSWGYSFADVVPANASDKAITQAGVMVARTPGQLSPSFTAAPPVPTGSGLNISLASDTAAGGTHASGSAYNNALKVNLTAGSGSINVNAITLTRGGISIDSNIGGVAAFDGAGKRLTNNFISFADSKAVLTFSTPLVVAAGSVTPVWFKTNITGTAGTYFLSVASAADASGASGTFPVTGNTFTMVSGGATVGNLSVDAVQVYSNGANDVTAVNVNLATTNQQLTKFRFVQANSNEDVIIKSITLYNNGNTNDADIQNIKLLGPDGAVLSTVLQTTGRWVTFDLHASPYKLLKGNTRDLSVNVDIISGSTRNFRLVIQNDYDVEVSGVSTGSGILATAATTVDGAFPIGDSAGGGANCAAGVTCINKITVNSGTALFSKANDAPSGNVAAGGSSIVLGKWEMTPQGEDMEVRQVAYTLTYGTALTGTFRIKLNDTTVYSVAGGSTAATGVGSGNLTASTYVTLKAGVKAIFTAVGDINSTTASGQTYLVALDVPQVKRLSTGDLFDPGITSTGANTLTVNTAALTVAKNSSFSDTTVVSGLSSAKVASFNLTASSTEDVTVSSITTGLTNVTNVSNLTLKSGSIQLGSVTVSPATTGNVTSITGFTVPKGTSVAVDLYVTTNGSTTGTEVGTISAISATGKDSSASVTATGTTATGQTITFSVGGTLTIAVDSTNTPVASIAHSGEVDRVVLATRLTSNNAEAVKVGTVQVSTSEGNTSLKDLKLFVNGAQVGTTVQLNSGVASFTASDTNAGLFTVSQDSSVTMYVKASTTTSSTIDSTSVANLALDYLQATGVSGGTTIKPGTTLQTTWTAGNAAVAGANDTVGSTSGFHRGDVVYMNVNANGVGGTLGIVTAEPTSTTTLAIASMTARVGAATGTIAKIASGAWTTASGANAVIAGSSPTVGSSRGFSVGDPVLARTSAGVYFGFISAIAAGTTGLTVKTLTANANPITLISKIGTDTLSITSATTGNFIAGTVKVMTVTASTGFNVGDMVLIYDSTNAGSFGIVTATTSTTISINSNGAVTNAAITIIRVGAANPATALVTTASTIGTALDEGDATFVVTSNSGFGVNDVVIGSYGADGAILGRVSATATTTGLTIFSNTDGAAVASTRLTRLPGAAAAGNTITFHDVEPVISASAGFTGGATAGGSGQVVGMYDIKADGDRNMNVPSFRVKMGGSNFPYAYVNNFDLYSGATLLSSATDSIGTAQADAGGTWTINAATTTINLCHATTDANANGELAFVGLGGATGTIMNKIKANDVIVFWVSTTAYATYTVSAISTGVAACTGGGANTNDVVLTVTNGSIVGAVSDDVTPTLYDYTLTFDSTASPALASQTITAGSTLTLTVKADTTAVKTGVTSGNVNFNTRVNGTQGSTGDLTWNYTPSGGSAISNTTVADSYPVNGPTLIY